MSKLQAPDKEATVRFTVDMSESLHRKLSMLAAKTGRKKVDIVRMLLEDGIEGGGRVKAIVLARIKVVKNFSKSSKSCSGLAA
jgi:predicted DNA-binding protein